MIYDVTLTSQSVKFGKFFDSDIIICVKSYKSENDNSFYFLGTLWSVSVTKNKRNKIACF